MSDVVEKIRKLLRLARDKGATEHEASVAMEMAQRLMLQHNIKNVEEQREVHAVFGEWMNVDRGDLWEQLAASGVAKLFNCRLLQRPSIGAYQFIGKPENIEACSETFLWVCGQIEALYKEALRVYNGTLDKNGRADLRKSFKQACALRVCQRIDEIIAKARNDIPAHMALVVIDQSLSAADDLIKTITTVESKPAKVKYGIGTAAGRLAGDRVRLQGSVGKE